MDYRTQLEAQLARRREVNPRYSLRAFAKKVGLSPSKLSEVLSKKRCLSLTRATDVAGRLGLSGKERQAFLLSVGLDAAKGAERKRLKAQMEALATELEPSRSTQRNAWYFGAIRALDEMGIDAARHAAELGVTDLQVENARRYEKRLRRFFPERESYSFEPVSILKRLSEGHLARSDAALDAGFAFLGEAEIERLGESIRRLVREISSNRTETPPADALHLVHWGFVKLIN